MANVRPHFLTIDVISYFPLGDTLQHMTLMLCFNIVANISLP